MVPYKMDMQCKHINMKKYKDRSIYIYKISSEQDVILCPDCNMNLAGEINKQMAIEVFLDNQIKIKEVKDVRKRRSGNGSGRERH